MHITIDKGNIFERQINFFSIRIFEQKLFKFRSKT